MKHRYLSILLALIIMFTMNPAAVYAAAESASVDPAAAVLDELESVETETFGTPADVGVGEELNDVPETDNVYSADSPESFADIVKQCLLRRETPFAVTIDYEVPLEGSEDLQAIYDEKFDLVNKETAKAVHDLALAHTGVPKEGDYLRYSLHDPFHLHLCGRLLRLRRGRGKSGRGDRTDPLLRRTA